MAIDCSPAGLVKASNCFPCLTSKQTNSVRSQIISQLVCGGGTQGGSTCRTPAAPFGIALRKTPVGVCNPCDTTIQITWKQNKNSGSLITGYIVSWGTTSGVYTSNSGVLAASPLGYTITGLTPGTQYFIVVQAVAFAGCLSANAAEFTSTTTGSSICNAGTTFAAAWAARVVAAGGAAPSAATQQVVAVLQCGLIADGLDPKLPSWNLFVPDSLTACACPQKVGEDLTSQWNLQNFVAGDLTINGLKGDGATKFINPGQMIIPANHSAQSIGVFVYTSVAGSSVNGRAVGNIQSVSATPGILIGTVDNTANTTGLNGANAGNVLTTPNHGAGFYSDQRVSNVDHRLYYASSGSAMAQIGATDAVAYNGGFSDSGSFFFCINQGGSALLFSNERLSCGGITTGLSLADLTNLFARFDTARRALGGGFI